MRTLWALVALAPLALAARSCTPRDVGSMDDWAPADFECAAAVSADALWTGGKDNLTALLAATDKWVADHLAHVPGDDYPRIRESLSSALAFLTAMADVLGGCASPQSNDRAQLTPTERLRGAWAATAEQRYMLAVLSPSDVATRAWIVARTVSVHLAVTLQATCRVPIPRVAPPAPAELFSVPWDTETSGFALDLGVPTPAIMFLYSPKDLTAWAKLVHWDEWTQAWVAEAAGPLTLETWAVMSDEQRVAVMKANGKTLRDLNKLAWEHLDWFTQQLLVQGYEKSAEAGVVLYQALGNSLSMMEIQMSDSSPTECWRARFETKQHAAVLAIMGYTSEVPLLGEVMPAASSIVFARPPTDRANWAPKLAALVYHLNNFASMLFYMAGDAADPSWTPASQQVSPSIFLRVNQPGPFLQQDMSLLVSLLAQPQPLPRATTVGEVEAVCGKDRRACLEWPREGSTLPEGAFVFGPWALRQDYEDAQRIGLSLRQGFDDYSMLMFVKIADFMGEWQQWSLPASQDATPLVINLAGSAVPYTVEAIVNASTHASPLEADWALLTDNAARAKLRSDLQSCSQRWDGGRPDRFTLSPGAQEALRGMQLPPTHGNLRLAQTMARYALPFRGWSGHPAVAANPQRLSAVMGAEKALLKNLGDILGMEDGMRCIYYDRMVLSFFAASQLLMSL